MTTFSNSLTTLAARLGSLLPAGAARLAALLPTSAARLGSLLPRTMRTTRRKRVVRDWADDWFRTHPSVGLTPSSALALLHAADDGSPAAQFELFGEMLRKWPRLAAVEATRRLALTGLEWEIMPCAADRGGRRARPMSTPSTPSTQSTQDDMDHSQPALLSSMSPGLGGDEALAGAAADYCRAALECLDSFDAALRHLASAIGHGIAVCELVWERARLIDIVPVPHSRLMSDPHEPWRLRVRTEHEPSLGVPLDASPNKWIVHQPFAQPGRHFDGGLLRASALLYLAQNFALKDWLIYSQVAGMPLRVARYEAGTPEADRAALLKMLERLGTDSVAVMSKSAELSLIEARGGEKPYQAIQDYCNTEITILWLGQHLTTDVRTSGSRAAAEIHDRVREDLLVGDIAAEGATLRRDLLTPLVRARFGDAAPVPLLRRSLMQSVDTRVLAETLSRAIRELGIRVPKRWAHRALGIPEPRADEAVLTEGGQ